MTSWCAFWPMKTRSECKSPANFYRFLPPNPWNTLFLPCQPQLVHMKSRNEHGYGFRPGGKFNLRYPFELTYPYISPEHWWLEVNVLSKWSLLERYADMLIFGGCFSRQLDFHVESCQGRLWEDEASLAAQAVDNMQEPAGVSIKSLVCVPNDHFPGPQRICMEIV